MYYTNDYSCPGHHYSAFVLVTYETLEVNWLGITFQSLTSGVHGKFKATHVLKL